MPIVSIVLSGCGKGDADATPSSTSTTESKTGQLLKIAVIPKGTTHSFWKAIHAGAAKAELELDGIQIIWKGPQKEDDREQQIAVVENFTTAKVDGIVIAPLDNTALLKPVRQAVAAGVEVVVFDSALEGEVGKDFVSFVATDNYEGGVKAGKRMGEILGGKGKVMMLRYQIGSASTMKREDGFLDTIKKEFPDIELISTDERAGATVESAMAKAENLLNKFTEVDGIYTPNESSTFGMLRALQNAGRAGKIKFVGFDSSPKLLEAMENDEIHGLVLQDPINMGYLGVKTMVSHLRGQPIETRIDTGSVVATKENMTTERIKGLLSPPTEKYLTP